MLGFRGHFSTKSRAYSVTLGAVRADRATHQREYADPSITLRVYAHVISDQLTEAAGIFARAVAATS